MMLLTWDFYSSTRSLSSELIQEKDPIPYEDATQSAATCRVDQQSPCRSLLLPKIDAASSVQPFSALPVPPQKF